MEIDRTVFVGVGGVQVGAVLAFAFGASGRAALEAQLRQAGDVTATVAGLETTLGSLHERVAGIDSRIAGVEGAVTAIQPAHQEALHGLAGRIEGLGDELSGAVSGLGARVGERLETDLTALRERLSEFGAGRVAAVGATVGAAGSGDGSVAPVAGPGAGETIPTGAAASLADGAVRVFLSATDPPAGAARVAVNGVATTTLALGAPADIDGCALTLTGFAPGGATFDADCGTGDAAAAERQAAAEPQAAVAAAGPGPGQEVRVGGAASLGDGAVRVFLSAIDPAAGTARAAIDGVAITPLALGAPVAAGACNVMLTGFTPGGATIEAACDGGPAAAGAAPASDATAAAAGPALAPGQTGVFGDGKLRVFVSAVDAADGAARVAVNGTVVTALRQGEPVKIDGCTLTLTGVGPEGAALDAAC